MDWTRKQFSILSMVAITSFMGTFLISSINIALPAIEKSFDMDAVTLSWVVTSFLLSMALLLLPAGRWGDLTGIRRLFKFGVILFTISSLFCGIAPSGYWLILFRFIQGAGAAFTSTTGPAILVSAFPPRQRGRVLGMSVSAVYLGLAFGPFAGGILTQSLGWRSIFYASAFLGTGVAIITQLFLGKDDTSAQESKSKLSLNSLVFYVAGLTSMVFGSSIIPKLPGWVLIGTGFIALMVFWKRESRSAHPVIPTRLFTQNRLFAFSNLAALINYSATFAIVFLLSLFLQKIQHMTPRQAGMVLIAQPTVMAIFSPVAGRWSDKLEPRILATLGMTMCALGLGAFTLLGQNTSIGMLVALLIWMGLGFALFSSPNMNTIMSSVDKNRYGLASGTAATMRVLGQMASMTIVTFMFALLFNGHSVDTISFPTFLKAMKYGFLTFALIAAAGIFFSYNRGNMNRE